MRRPAFSTWAEVAGAEYQSVVPIPQTHGGHLLWQEGDDPPRWIVFLNVRGPPDVDTAVNWCLMRLGSSIEDLSATGKTFPIGTYCHGVLMGLPTSTEVANLLAARRDLWGPQVVASITIFKASPPGTPPAIGIAYAITVMNNRLRGLIYQNRMRGEDPNFTEWRWPMGIHRVT